MGLVLATALIDVAIPCTPPSIDITYAAHTASCTFLLDSEGICRRIVVAPKGKRSASRTASRCVGAQYVASLEGSAAGGLVEMPRVGAAMLFARVDDRGRVSLVRTGVVLSFESNAGEDPFADSGTVETSAPELETPRMERPIPSAPGRDIDHDYDDSSEKTQRIQALRPEDIAAALEQRERTEDPDLGSDLATAEYRTVVDDAAPRPTLPSTQALPNVPTLRNPHRDTTIEDGDSYARPKLPAPTPPRGVLQRRSDPRMRAAAARAYAPRPAPSPTPAPAPRAYSSDIQVSRHRRGT
jgi:hypothetical protein